MSIYPVALHSAAIHMPSRILHCTKQVCASSINSICAMKKNVVLQAPHNFVRKHIFPRLIWCPSVSGGILLKLRFFSVCVQNRETNQIHPICMTIDEMQTVFAFLIGFGWSACCKSNKRIPLSVAAL